MSSQHHPLGGLYEDIHLQPFNKHLQLILELEIFIRLHIHQSRMR